LRQELEEQRARAEPQRVAGDPVQESVSVQESASRNIRLIEAYASAVPGDPVPPREVVCYFSRLAEEHSERAGAEFGQAVRSSIIAMPSVHGNAFLDAVQAHKCFEEIHTMCKWVQYVRDSVDNGTVVRVGGSWVSVGELLSAVLKIITRRCEGQSLMGERRRLAELLAGQTPRHGSGFCIRLSRFFCGSPLGRDIGVVDFDNSTSEVDDGDLRQLALVACSSPRQE
jgi:hypothetical protein